MFVTLTFGGRTRAARTARCLSVVGNASYPQAFSPE